MSMSNPFRAANRWKTEKVEKFQFHSIQASLGIVQIYILRLLVCFSPFDRLKDSTVPNFFSAACLQIKSE